MNYHFIGEDEIDSPALIYYQDVIEENTDKAVAMAGSPERLWPHMKSHKTSQLLKMQMERGVKRFKCATIAEAELCAITGAPHALVAYPLVGPAIGRFIKLREKYSSTNFWALGDNLEQLELLGKAASDKSDLPVNTLIDVNMGMNRTGILVDQLEDFYLKAVKIKGLAVKGLHCYDGHLCISDLDERKKAASLASEGIWKAKESLEKKGCEIPVFIMGGTPTFACHRERKDVFLSPGTFFINDSGYSSGLPDLEFTPGAAILTRVVSHPAPRLFTVDTGVKAISTDHAERGILVDIRGAKPVLHSEEHWVWKLEDTSVPPIGSILYIIPNHICPTSALYPGVHVVKNGKLSDYWEIGARNRKITV